MTGSKRAPGPAGHGEVFVLIGVSGSGKSTIGRLLSAALEAPFLDGDDYHPAANVAKMRAGVPLTDADRWSWLDRLGGEIVGRAATGRPVVVACSALRQAYRARLAMAADRPLTFLHLEIASEVLRARMAARLGHFMPASLLQSQLATLEPLRPGEDGTVISESGSSEETVTAILHWIDDRTASQEKTGS